MGVVVSGAPPEAAPAMAGTAREATKPMAKLIILAWILFIAVPSYLLSHLISILE
jgi:hypothetical protein